MSAETEAVRTEDLEQLADATLPVIAEVGRLRHVNAVLLEALKECESWMSAVYDVHGGSSADAAKIDRARSAIFLAEKQG